MEHVGIEIVGDEAWNPKASSYEALMNKIKGTGRTRSSSAGSSPRTAAR